MVKPKKKIKKVVYTPIGNSISPEATFVQAAIALDVAAQFAIQQEDARELNRTAELWIEMSKGLLEIEEDAGPPKETEPVGFRTIDTEEEENGSIDGPRDDESPSEGKRRVYTKHGELRVPSTRHRP